MTAERPEVPDAAPEGGTRERLVEATLACLRRAGSPKVSIAAISREAGISRQTVYTQYGDRDALVNEAVEAASLAFADRIARDTARLDDPTDAIVEAVVRFCLEAQRDPVIRMTVAMTTTPGVLGAGTIPPRTLQMMRRFVRPLLVDDPEALARLDAISETVLRFLLSLLTYSSAYTEDEAALRGYLQRYLGGALGLR